MVEANIVAMKRVIAWELLRAMKEKRLTKSALALRMATSRASLDRLLDPENGAVTLWTLGRAAAVLGKQLDLKVV